MKSSLILSGPLQMKRQKPSSLLFCSTRSLDSWGNFLNYLVFFLLCQGIVQFLVNENGFNIDRVTKVCYHTFYRNAIQVQSVFLTEYCGLSDFLIQAVEKIKSAKNKSSQGRFVAFEQTSGILAYTSLSTHFFLKHFTGWSLFSSQLRTHLRLLRERFVSYSLIYGWTNQFLISFLSTCT